MSELRAIYESIDATRRRLTASKIRLEGMADQCFKDARRTYKLMHFLAQTLIPGRSFLDAGSGTGVLGFTASAVGSPLVQLVERESRLVDFQKRTALNLGYKQIDERAFEKEGRRVELYCANLFDFEPTQPLGGVFVEMFGRALLTEDILAAGEYLKQFTTPDTQYYPEKIELIAELLGNTSRNHFRFQDELESLGEPKVYRREDIRNPHHEPTNCTITFPIEEYGRPQKVRFTSRLLFPQGLVANAYLTLGHPLIVPILNPQDIPTQPAIPGDECTLHITHPVGEELSADKGKIRVKYQSKRKT